MPIYVAEITPRNVFGLLEISKSQKEDMTKNLGNFLPHTNKSIYHPLQVDNASYIDVAASHPNLQIKK